MELNTTVKSHLSKLQAGALRDSPVLAQTLQCGKSNGLRIQLLRILAFIHTEGRIGTHTYNSAADDVRDYVLRKMTGQ